MTQRGFTLIELLVALMILVLLSLAAYRGLDSVIQTHERISKETRHWQQLTRFFNRMEQDIALAIARPARDQGGLRQPEWIGNKVVVANDQADLIFTRGGIEGFNISQSVPQRIGYRFEDNRIMLLRWPSLDQAPRSEPKRYPLLEGVADFKLRYLHNNGSWLEQWPPPGQVGGRPMAVEVTLTMEHAQPISRLFGLQ